MGNVSDFASKFARFWVAPDPEDLRSILTDDVRLIQPLLASTVGLPAAIESFRRLFGAIPDLRGEVDRWRGADDVLFIEFRMRGTIGRRVVEWPAVDRFLLRGEMACERVSYFDGARLAKSMLRTPIRALRLLR